MLLSLKTRGGTSILGTMLEGGLNLPASSCMRGEEEAGIGESQSGVCDGLLIRIFGRVYPQSVSDLYHAWICESSVVVFVCTQSNYVFG